MARKKSSIEIQTMENVQQRNFLIRGQRAILGSDLGAHYGVPVKVLNQAVSRN